MADAIFQKEIWFEGHVQGVGFRYQTVSVAKGFEVTGTVRNLPDGRVHLFAEGDSGEVEAFCREVSAELSDYIRTSESREGKGPRTCSSFSILR